MIFKCFGFILIDFEIFFIMISFKYLLSLMMGFDKREISGIPVAGTSFICLMIWM